MTVGNPRVTVITPTYNRADLLPETIESILSQDYPNLEYIVLDDGSKDHTGEVLQKYGNRLLWKSHPNMGEVRTVNAGFQMATGDIIGVVNSDDPLLPGAIRIIVEYLQNNPNVLVAYPDWNYIDQNSIPYRSMHRPEYDYVGMVSSHLCYPGPGSFFRKEGISLTGGGRDPSYRYVSDFDFWLRLGLFGPFIHVPLTLATFRVHSGSTSVKDQGIGIAEEGLQLIQSYYQRKDLPPTILAVRKKSFSSAFFQAALACRNQPEKARLYFWRSLQQHPINFFARVLYWKETALSALLPKPLWDFMYFIVKKKKSPSLIKQHG
jgi:glycosyltransferase involved in cell wall biosynthesis